MKIKLNTMNQAVELFGSKAEIGRALNKTRSAISAWPNRFSLAQKDRILGAAIRTGRINAELSIPE